MYGTATAKGMGRVQKVINFDARVITGRCKHYHVSDALQTSAWIPARELVTYDTLHTELYIVTSAPHDIAERLARVGQGRECSTRQDADLALPRIRSESGRRSFFLYHAASAFNVLRLAREKHYVLLKGI